MEEKIDYVNHEYRRTLGDQGLALIRALVRDPEVRHTHLGTLAKMGNFVPGISSAALPELKTVMKFRDKSNSLYLQSPVILAAGANKDASRIGDFASLGFGGITVGTATRHPREGNPHRPRVSLLSKDRGIVNAMGLNNPGVRRIAEAVDRGFSAAHKGGLSVGISIAESPGETDDGLQLEEMVATFQKAYVTADYVEINVSCPNTGSRRTDSRLQFLDSLLTRIMEIRRSIAVRKAVFAKLSPDMGEKQLHATLDLLEEKGVNGLILFNTFPAEKAKFLDLNIDPSVLQPLSVDGRLGGISGRPLYMNTFRAVEYIRKRHPGFSVIASGGIDHGSKVWDLLRVGADVVQAYSVMVYRWKAIHKMNRELRNCLRAAGYRDMEEFQESQRTSSFS